MKTQLTLAAAIAVGATGAYAGGMDRSGQSIAPLFEDGSYVELSFGNVNPTVSGVFTHPTFGDFASGDMASTYTMFGAAYKRDLSDALSMAIIIDQPFGADVDYGDADANYPFATASAKVSTTGVSAILRYKLNDNFAVHGGVRALRSHGEVSLPAIPSAPAYTLDTSNETDYSYLVGASYEIPDIALRAAVTYNSKTTINFDTTESTEGSQTLEVIMPESINFDFQTGIAADTLLMVSARYAKWTQTVIDPVGYAELVSYDDDTISYSLGLGRRFSEKLSASISYGFEKSAGTPTGNLGPTDGYKSVSIGAKYNVSENTAISGGLRYVWIGDATTSTIGSEFTDNNAVGFGLKLSHSF
ncbi:OmpP1/FadL family transporter [Celeribacter marinus]|uniref:Outer membrane transporter, OMPP1/FadL/TodX family n=1 Tax=Celeribacter marinus TaxID=1397108 RepID=A0A0P0A816_9RHOB|nr:outer membrane protein transport protein [Celeribacter marinus]ALI54563.1 outer membrane transporter, OMPP1/FadL/TodX family [Celeribacter marinus]SFK80245.1 Long-chain fatty acid transport protein [Celeribacter marinus]